MISEGKKEEERRKVRGPDHACPPLGLGTYPFSSPHVVWFLGKNTPPPGSGSNLRLPPPPLTHVTQDPRAPPQTPARPAGASLVPCVRVLHKLDAVGNQVEHVEVVIPAGRGRGRGAQWQRQRREKQQGRRRRVCKTYRWFQPSLESPSPTPPPDYSWFWFWFWFCLCLGWYVQPPPHLWSIFMRSVALPSSTSPRRMSSNRRRLSSMGRSRQGLGSRFSRLASISSLVCVFCVDCVGFGDKEHCKRIVMGFS